MYVCIPREDIIRHLFARYESVSAHWNPANRVASRKEAGGFSGKRNIIPD